MQKEIITYSDEKNRALDRIEITNWDNHLCYRILENDNIAARTNSSELLQETWQDTRPIQCLLVAIDRYPENSLKYCCEDMLILKNYLEQHFLQYQQSCEIQTLFDQDATKVKFFQALQQQTKKSSRFSTTILAFSGHGENNGLQLYDQKVEASELQPYFIANQSSRLLWIMDACHAENLGKDLDYEFKAYSQTPKELQHRQSKAVSRHYDLYPNTSPYPFAHIFLGHGKVLFLSSLANEEAKDGVFLRSLVYHLEATDIPLTIPQLLKRIQDGIFHHNKRCRPENRLDMTPQAKIYGDIQIWIMPWTK